MEGKQYENFYITIDGEFLKVAEEEHCYDHEYIDDFENEEQYLKWAKCLTGKLDKIENINMGIFQIFKEYSGLPMYSYG